MKDLKSIVDKEASRYGEVKYIKKSETVFSVQSHGNDGLRVELDLMNYDPKQEARVRFWIDSSEHHNCECHKAAALCFFQWGKDGTYKQVPMIDGIPSTTYIELGQLKEVDLISDAVWINSIKQSAL